MSASFKPATSVSYDFTEPPRNGSAVSTDLTLRGENVSLSFRTFQSPAVLLHVGSHRREFLAVLINKHGEEGEKREGEGGAGGGARWKR